MNITLFTKVKRDDIKVNKTLFINTKKVFRNIKTVFTNIKTLFIKVKTDDIA